MPAPSLPSLSAPSLPSLSAPSLPSLSPLVARDVAKSYGATPVLDGVDLVASPGRPLGLVGENGAGKSTLLRLLAGLEPPDAGSVAAPPELAYLGQEPSFPGCASVGDVLARALAPLHDLVHRLEVLAGRLEDAGAEAEYAALLDLATLHDAWGADRRVDLAAARLGLAGLPRDREVARLSGGERTRLALAALVTRQPSCVLLDEPTNHLDDEAAGFLEEFLRGLPGVAVVASHDRTFLDNVTAEVVDLDPGHLGTDGDGGSRFGGGYTGYLAAKRDARRRWERAWSDQQQELADLRGAAATTARRVAHGRPPRDNDKLGYFGKGHKVARAVSRRVRDTERRIELLERDPVPRPRPLLAFREQLAPRATDGPVVAVRDLVVTDRLRLPRLDLTAGEHLLVSGPNGCGKSSLLEVLAGRLAPTSGSAHTSARRVGYLPQEVTFARPDLSARRVYDGLTGAPVPLHSLGLLHPRDLTRPVGLLSVGQQRRLALALLVARRPDLVLLDEPTNHISPALADELEHAVGGSAGTVVLASHDRWLRARWTGRELTLAPDARGPRAAR